MMMKYGLVKQTITTSPITTLIYSNFQYNTAKWQPDRGHETLKEDQQSSKTWCELSKSISLINQQCDNTVVSDQVKESQKSSYDFDNDDFDDDELIKLTKPKPIPKNSWGLVSEDVDIVVKNTSIWVNEKEYRVHDTIRSSCHLRGMEDDILLLILQNGNLLLINLYQGVPLIIQEVELHHQLRQLEMSSLGRGVYAQDDLILVTSMTCNLRFCHYVGGKVVQSKNFLLNGDLLLNCFIKFNKGHTMFLTLISTTLNFIQFQLFEKWNDESIDQIKFYSPILMPSDFPLPMFLTSVNDTVVMIYPDAITLMGLNYLISYDLNDFLRHIIEEKITLYYIPEKGPVSVSQDQPLNEFLISTDKGGIYSICINNIHQIGSRLIHQLPVCTISNFTMNFKDNMWKLIYSQDTSDTKTVLLDSSFNVIETITKHSWAPVIDFNIVERKNEQEELWILGNLGKKTSLYQLHQGLKLSTLINDTFFKELQEIKTIYHDNKILLMFNYTTFNKLYQLIDQDLKLLDMDEMQELPSLSFSIYHDSLIHITERSITVYDLINNSIIHDYQMDTFKIVMSHVYEELIAIIFQTGTGLVLEIMEIDDYDLKSIYKLSLTGLEPSMLKFTSSTECAIGFFNNDLIFIDVPLRKVHEVISINELRMNFEIPNDIITLNGTTFLSSRSGSYIVFPMRFDGFEDASCYKLSDSSTKFIKIDNHNAFIISKYVYKISSSADNNPVRCYFDGLSNSTKILDLSYVKETNEVFVITSKGLNISNLNSNESEIIINKRIKLLTNCKKLFNAHFLKIFIIITGSKFANTPTEEPIICVNQITKRKMKLIQMNQIFDHDEVITTITDWKFEHFNDKEEWKCHLQLLISCFDTVKGVTCIKVVELRKNNDELTLNKLFQWNCDFPGLISNLDLKESFVNHLKQFSNEIIIYNVNEFLFKIQYNYHLKKFDKPELIYKFHTLITKIVIHGSYIIITLRAGSFVILQKIDNDFKLIIKDDSIRNIYDLLIIDNKLIALDISHKILLISTLPNISGQPNTEDERLSIPFDSLSKIRQCHLSPRWAPSYLTPVKRFISCSINGEICTYTFLPESWVMNMQDILESNSTKCCDWLTQYKHVKGLLDLVYPDPKGCLHRDPVII